MKNVRTMPKTVHQSSRKVIGRASSSTPIKSSGIANLGYSQATVSRIKHILAEM